jgi:hypothetical protein
MSQEIFYWLLVLFIVATVWYAARLVDYFLQKGNDSEAQESGTQIEGSAQPPKSK